MSWNIEQPLEWLELPESGWTQYVSPDIQLGILLIEIVRNIFEKDVYWGCVYKAKHKAAYEQHFLKKL